MKKLMALLLATAMIFVLCACGNQNSTSADPVTEAPTQAPTNTPDDTPTEAPTQAPTDAPEAKGISYSNLPGVWVAKVDLKALFADALIAKNMEAGADSDSIAALQELFALIPDGKFTVDWNWGFYHSYGQNGHMVAAAAEYDEQAYEDAYLGFVDAYMQAMYTWNSENTSELDGVDYETFYNIWYSDIEEDISWFDEMDVEFESEYEIVYKCGDGKLYINSGKYAAYDLTEEDIVEAEIVGDTLTILTPIKGGEYGDPICEHLFPLTLHWVQEMEG